MVYKTRVIPTERAIETFRRNLATAALSEMVNFNELVNLAVTTVQYSEAQGIPKDALNLLAGLRSRYTRNDDSADRKAEKETTANVVANSWSVLAAELFSIYNRLDLWDSTGYCDYRFDRMLGDDIVLGREEAVG